MHDVGTIVDARPRAAAAAEDVARPTARAPGVAGAEARGHGAGAGPLARTARAHPRPGGGRRPGRWLKRGALALAAAAAIAGGALALRPGPEFVEMATARRDTLYVSVRESGRTRVADRYVVSAPASGHLTRVTLRPGDAVGEGEAIALVTPLVAPLLDPRARAEAEARAGAAAASRARADANVARAEAALAFARGELEREGGLARDGAQTEQALRRAELEARLRAQDAASARFGARVAEHELALARAALAPPGPGGASPRERIPVDSPVAGRVLRVLRQSEGAVQAGTPLLEIGDPSALEIVVDLLSADAVRVRPGAIARVEGWGGPAPLRARVRGVEPSAFTKTSALGIEEQRVNVVLDLDEPFERRAALGDGYQVDAEIVLEEVPGALVVPEAALFRQGETWALYAEEGGAASLRTVRLGARDGRRAQIVDGLEPGARVVTRPNERVREGTRIVPR
jgi:HlyD family secretion protein